MKGKLFTVAAGILILTGMQIPPACYSQKSLTKKYLTALPSGKPDNDGSLRKYKMTAVYTNLDLYGNFSSKMLVTGDYTKGSKDNTVSWNNVFIAGSNNKTEPFNEGAEIVNLII